MRKRLKQVPYRTGNTNISIWKKGLISFVIREMQIKIIGCISHQIWQKLKILEIRVAVLGVEQQDS